MATNTGSNLPETGEEWLCLLVREPLYLFPEWVHCSGCGVFVTTGGTICGRCGGECEPIDWRSVSRKIRLALRSQKGLLARLKAEYENLFPSETRKSMLGPNLTGEFSWLVYSWRRARRPKGRPFEAWQIYKLANLIVVRSELEKAYREDKNPETIKALEYIRAEIDKESFTWKNWKAESVTRREKRIIAWVRKNHHVPLSRWLRRRI